MSQHSPGDPSLEMSKWQVPFSAPDAVTYVEESPHYNARRHASECSLTLDLRGRNEVQGDETTSL